MHKEMQFQYNCKLVFQAYLVATCNDVTISENIFFYKNIMKAKNRFAYKKENKYNGQFSRCFIAMC